MKPTLPALALAAVLGVASSPGAAAGQAEGAEVLTYRWELKGLVGRLARIFIPGTGEGAIINRPTEEGRLESEFRITSEGAAKKEFWSYGSLIDPGPLRPVETWNASHYRGRDRHREAEITESGIVDIPTAIHLLRKRPPDEPLRLLLWTDGKMYPVLFESHGMQRKRVAGQQRLVMAHSVVGLKEPELRTWDGRLDLWTTPDEAAIPLEILFRRDGAKVELTLVAPEPPD